MLVRDKVAIVSGVGPGLGEALATVLSRHGASVVLAARSADRLDDLVDRINAAGGQALGVPTDVAEPGDRAALIAAAVERFGRVDVLVNNAVAYAPYDLIEHSDLEGWRRVFEVNLFGAIGLCQAVVPHMKAVGGGSIVMINSMVIRTFYAQQAPQNAYAASKGALYSSAQVMAGELGPHNIRVNSVVPGWIYGPRVKERFARDAEARGVTADEVYGEVASRSALRRLVVPEDVANAALYFASDLSSGVTGQSIDVNAGEVFH